MSTSRDATSVLKTGIVRKILAEFNVSNVDGVNTIPTTIQVRPQPFTEAPYIYINKVRSNETDKTKTSASRDYQVSILVVTESAHNQSTEKTRDQIAAEVVRILDTTQDGYIDLLLDGFNIYTQNAETGETDTNETQAGITQFGYSIDAEFTIDFVGLPENTNPVQNPSFAFSLFSFPPQNNQIERYDSGVITPSTTYPSNNNGWNFIDASYSISPGAGGTFANGDYDVTNAADPVSLDSSLRYEFIDDTSTTTTLSATTSFERIDSIRYGAITPQTVGILPTLADDLSATYGLRLLSNWNIEYGTVRPHNETITITGNSNQYVYIIIDHGVTLTQVRNTIGQNVIAQFNVQTIGDYKIYLNTNPIVFDGFSTDYTLIA